ncbi:MAG: FAD-dependent oxidoreductase [bacterium]
MTDVLVIGAGPAGLTAAAALAGRGLDVRVVDRDEAPGGVPRSSDHPGYGLRDLRRPLTGPAYARMLAERASGAGARIDVRTTVTDLDAVDGGGAAAWLTSPSGREEVRARAAILATGCRERPRTARLVPGTRPAGILTTGWLQRLVHLDHGSPGTRAVVVGAEHVSYSAVVTLADAGCRTVAMITEDDAHTSFAAFDIAARTRYGFPLLARARVEAIHGSARVAGVAVVRDDGARAYLECDTVVFTGDWYPENDLAVRAGLPRQRATHGPSIDAALRTPEPGILAAGNVLHPAATADACARDGAHVVAATLAWLESGAWPVESVPLVAEAPLLWATPDLVTPGAAGPVRLQTGAAANRPRLSLLQGERTLWSGRLPYIRPTRPFAIPGRALEDADMSAPVRAVLD